MILILFPVKAPQCLAGPILLGMEALANDDLYCGCEDKMYQDVQTKLLAQERARDPQYDLARRNAERSESGR